MSLFISGQTESAVSLIVARTRERESLCNVLEMMRRYCLDPKGRLQPVGTSRSEVHLPVPICLIKSFKVVEDNVLSFLIVVGSW